VRFGLAGLGAMGRNHLRVLSLRDDVQLAAIADPDPSALAAASHSTDAQLFDEPLAMIGEAELDALIVAAPTTGHLSLALAAIDRGLPVLVEKPLAASTAEAA
jgi:predicted dehydrogenase